MEKLKNFWHNDVMVLLLRLSILYLVLIITQVVFYAYNSSLLGPVHWADLPKLIHGVFKFDTISILYLNSAFLVLSLLPFRFRIKSWYQKMLFWLYTISNSLGLIVFNLVDVIYYRYAFKRVTIEELHFFRENDNTGGILLKGMAENWYLVIVGIALIALMVFLYKKIRYDGSRIKRAVVYYPVHVLILGLGVVLYVFGVRSSFDLKARPVTMSNAALYAPNASQASMVLSNPFCFLRTNISKNFTVLHYFDEAEAQAIYTPYHYPSGEFAHQIGKKNIVLFVLESFNKDHSKFLMPQVHQNRDGFTPFLDSLMQEGFAFTNCYSNGMKSIEALPSILISIPSYQTSFPLLPQSIGEMEGLPCILAKEGYSTYFFCGSSEGQMGFEAIGKMAGINQFYNRSHFKKYNNGKDHANIWGVWDMDFLQYMAHQLNECKSPFFSAVFTLSSHHPYDLPEEYAGKMPQGDTPLQPCVAYTDLSIRKFFETASKEPWFENTLFIFVADHVNSRVACPDKDTPRSHSEILYFMYTPDHSLQGISNDVTQQLDIMPTVLGLLGYDKPYFAFGRDFFNEPQRKKAATNCFNQVYQCLTDSLSLYFDGEKVLHVFASSDTLQQHDILNLNDSRQKETERYLKAVLQYYTSHVNKKSYVIPSDSRQNVQ